MSAFLVCIEMSLETTCDHISRKSGKNMFSKHLRHLNTLLFRLNGKGLASSKSKMSPETNLQVALLHFDRLVLKLVPRELNQFMQLLSYFESDPHYDSVEAILSFTRDGYISRRNIHQDDEAEPCSGSVQDEAQVEVQDEPEPCSG